MVTAQNNNAQLYKHNALTLLQLLYIRADVSMLKIPYIILFRIFYNFSALCSNFHALFSKDYRQNNPLTLEIMLYCTA